MAATDSVLDENVDDATFDLDEFMPSTCVWSTRRSNTSASGAGAC